MNTPCQSTPFGAGALKENEAATIKLYTGLSLRMPFQDVLPFLAAHYQTTNKLGQTSLNGLVPSSTVEVEHMTV